MDTIGGGWWRRNWWGLLAVVPVLAATVLLSPYDSFSQWRGSQQREAVLPGPDGWADYGNRLRLVALEPADLRTRDGEPFPLPAGLLAWQATVEFGQVPDQDAALTLCEFRLQDGAGRLYADRPDLIREARRGPDRELLFTLGCRPEEEELANPVYQRLPVFVLPSSSEPVALRVAAPSELPRYARLPVAGGAGSPAPGG